MTHRLKLARRAVRSRVLPFVAAALGLAACNSADRLAPISLDDAAIAADSGALTPDSVPAVPTDSVAALPIDSSSVVAVDTLTLTGNTAQGVAFGAFDLPNDQLSSLTGSVRAVGPGDILQVLTAARSSGAQVVVRLSAGERFWTNGDHSVNLAKWESQVARFKNVDIQSYIADGTLLAHYLIDEPHDPSNWGGKPVPFATLEAMAKFSKQLWPGLATVVRSYPDWLSTAPFRWKYLDAAWSQYSARKGEVNAWMETQASYAKSSGLGLIVGLNWLDGGNEASGIKGNKRGAYAMSASQIKAWGSVLASNAQACAVYNWRYDPSYVGRSDIQAAIAYVAAQAKNRSRQSCRPSGQQSAAQVYDSPISPPVTPVVTPAVTPKPIVLKVSSRVQAGMQYMTLTWVGARGFDVDVYRNGAFHITTKNDERYTNVRRSQGAITYAYKVCEKGTSTCSNAATATLR